MAGKNTAAFAIFPNRAAAETAVDRLIAAGFSNQDVSVLMSDRQGAKDFAAEKNTKAPEGTTTGGILGGAEGGTLGALAGLGVGGAVGGLVGALIGLGIPEYEAKRYEGRVKDGGILVSVHCDSSEEVSRAKDVLKQAGGEDIASSGEKSVSTHNVDNDRARDYDANASGYDRVGPGRDVEGRPVVVDETTRTGTKY